MLGTKIYKPLQDNIIVDYSAEGTPTTKENTAPNTLKKYSELAEWCNANNATIEDKGDYYECVAIPEPTQSEKAEQVRIKRDSLLKESDIYLLSDYPISSLEKEQVIKYRQQLRDVPVQAGFPENITWPVLPMSLSKGKNYGI